MDKVRVHLEGGVNFEVDEETAQTLERWIDSENDGLYGATKRNAVTALDGREFTINTALAISALERYYKA